MKRGKIVLSIAAFATAIGGVFAFKTAKTPFQPNIYTSAGGGVYNPALPTCQFVKHGSELSCAVVTVNSNVGQYYYFNGAIHPIALGQFTTYTVTK